MAALHHGSLVCLRLRHEWKHLSLIFFLNYRPSLSLFLAGRLLLPLYFSPPPPDDSALLLRSFFCRSLFKTVSKSARVSLAPESLACDGNWRVLIICGPMSSNVCGAWRGGMAGKSIWQSWSRRSLLFQRSNFTLITWRWWPERMATHAQKLEFAQSC